MVCPSPRLRYTEKIKEKYPDNKELQQQLIVRLYQDTDTNPLAGCLPSLAQIPLFIALYRSVLNLALNDKIDQVRSPVRCRVRALAFRCPVFCLGDAGRLVDRRVPRLAFDALFFYTLSAVSSRRAAGVTKCVVCRAAAAVRSRPKSRSSGSRRSRGRRSPRGAASAGCSATRRCVKWETEGVNCIGCDCRSGMSWGPSFTFKRWDRESPSRQRWGWTRRSSRPRAPRASHHPRVAARALT